MPVTDLGDGLPWWLQGPGPTGAPTTQPQGSGGGAQSWLDYLYNMVNPVSSAQAGELDPRASALAALKAGGTPPVNNAIDPAVALSGAPYGGHSMNYGPPRPDPLGSSVTMAPGPPGAGPGGPPARPATGMGLQPGALSSANLGAYNRMPWPSGGGGLNPNTPPSAGQAAVGGVPRPAATGGAGGVGATSNPRFVQIDAPNLSAAGMGSRGAPRMTALNLGGLFRGGGGASNAPASAAPTQTASQPVRGPLASAPMPPVMPDDLRRQRLQQIAAARSGFA